MRGAYLINFNKRNVTKITFWAFVIANILNLTLIPVVAFGQQAATTSTTTLPDATTTSTGTSTATTTGGTIGDTTPTTTGTTTPPLGFGNILPLQTSTTSPDTSTTTASTTIPNFNLIGPVGGGGVYIELPYTSRTITYPKLVVTRAKIIPSIIIANGKSMIPFDGSVKYEITVKNIGGAAYGVTLHDQFWPEAEDKMISQKSWYFDEISLNQEITVDYSKNFDGSTAPGTYVNYAWADGLSGDTFEPYLAPPVGSNVAADKIIIAPKPAIAKIVKK